MVNRSRTWLVSLAVRAPPARRRHPGRVAAPGDLTVTRSVAARGQRDIGDSPYSPMTGGGFGRARTGAGECAPPAAGCPSPGYVKVMGGPRCPMQIGVHAL